MPWFILEHFQIILNILLDNPYGSVVDIQTSISIPNL